MLASTGFPGSAEYCTGFRREADAKGSTVSKVRYVRAYDVIKNELTMRLVVDGEDVGFVVRKITRTRFRIHRLRTPETITIRSTPPRETKMAYRSFSLPAVRADGARDRHS
jgi:hypothetical protein